MKGSTGPWRTMGKIVKQRKFYLFVSFMALLPLTYNACSGQGFSAIDNEIHRNIQNTHLNQNTPPPVHQGPGTPLHVMAAGARPLTVREYDASLSAILKDNTQPGKKLLPADSMNPFDGAFELASISQTKVEALEQVAQETVEKFLKDNNRIQSVLPCIPGTGSTGNVSSDLTCYKKIATQVGRRFFRRPLNGPETDRYANAMREFAAKSGNYKDGVEVFLRAMLQHPDFLYRWEVGQLSDPVKKIYTLNQFEFASKLSFALWGQPPDEELLNAAQAGTLFQAGELEKQVNRLLNDARALDHVDYFHSAWFGYSTLIDQTSISKSMRTETKALIKRVIFDENRAWKDLLTFDETFVDKTLADHYKFPAPSNNNGAWVKINDSARRGLFGHGSFLAVGGKFGDTSPTQRGYHIRKHVFCEMIPPPPPDVSTDMPPGSEINHPCKINKLEASVLKAGSACVACHQRMDYIGLGLERYSADGAYREVQPDAPECVISGQGDTYNYGKFTGPAGLAQVAINSGRVEMCLVQRWIQFTNGKKEDPKLEELTSSALDLFKEDGKFKNFIKKFVLSPEFKTRRELE